MRDIVAALKASYSDLLAVILYGSIARHDERPLDAPNPSDVDLLAIFDTDDELVTVHRGLDVSRVLGSAYGQHLDAPRDMRVMIASRTARMGSNLHRQHRARSLTALHTR